jgi:putative PIN family toxin of toxin-antitoxin system
MSGRSAKPRTVVDTNLFVSGTIREDGLPRRLLRAWKDELFHLLLSDRQLVELEDVFRRPKIVHRYRLAPDRLAELFDGLTAATRVVPNPTIPVRPRDSKGEHILALALGGDAEYIVTGDQDLLVLDGDPHLGHLRIVTVAEFLAILETLPSANGETP